ncbi:MAG: zinc-dependent alcohol dehydrogenase [Candidatus Excrementavichristensenella sp.]|jgi:threonine dehydrogenase-like Zn-dependent dehydrogenase
MAETCRAAVMTKKHTIEVWNVPMPKCGEDGMIIKIEAADICGTDLHLFQEDPMYPFVPSHEICGKIVEMGPKAAASMRCYTGTPKVGDRIALYPWVVCSTCENCLTYGIGACGICENSFVYGVPYETLGFGGAPIRSNNVNEAPYLKGGFAEYMYVFPGTFMWQIPGNMPSNVAALLDPMAVAMRGIELAMRAPGIFEDSFNLGSTALIIGDGPVGTLTATIARNLGVKHVLISGFSDYKLALAQKISGADETINVLKQPIDERRKTVCGYSRRDGADVVFQCAGSSHAFRDGIDLLKTVGTMVEVGNITKGHSIQFDPAADLTSKHATYIGMSVNTAKTFDKAYQMLLKFKTLGLDEIFTHRSTLDTLGATIAKGTDPDYLKGWCDLQ